MNPCALWRCMGSDAPGGYSTVIIRPSLPGRPERFFDKTSVTLASCAVKKGGASHTRHTIIFMNVIHSSPRSSYPLLSVQPESASIVNGRWPQHLRKTEYSR